MQREDLRPVKKQRISKVTSTPLAPITASSDVGCTFGQQLASLRPLSVSASSFQTVFHKIVSF